MTEPSEFKTPQGRRLAYHRHTGTAPGVVFLGGFRSDMTGTKAQYLQDWAEARGADFLRFDYSGHGQSSGAFEEGCIGDWAEDAMAAITALTDGPQILVGSSMGGWISLLIARGMPDRVAGLVTIAAAPDFTEDSMWSGFTAAERDQIARGDAVQVPSDYDTPYLVTPRLIADGRANLVLRAPLALPMPVRCLQGTADEDVSVQTALRLLEHADAPDLRLTLVKGADHRFSTPDCLALVAAAVTELRGGTRAKDAS